MTAFPGQLRKKTQYFPEHAAVHPLLAEQSAIGYTFYFLFIISKQEDIVKKNSSPLPAKEGLSPLFLPERRPDSPGGRAGNSNKKAPWQQREANVP